MCENPSDSSTDAFLLTLDERAILDVAALIGLRARTTEKNDSALIDAFLGSDAPFAKPRRPMLVTSLPGIRPC